MISCAFISRCVRYVKVNFVHARAGRAAGLREVRPFFLYMQGKQGRLARRYEVHLSFPIEYNNIGNRILGQY